MKAFGVDDYNGYSEGSIIVFAETRAKAKATAINTDEFCDFEWNELRAIRYPILDALYNGRAVVEWMDDVEITRVLVRDYGWHCYDTEGYSVCKNCELNKDCEYYIESIEEVKE